MRPRAGGTVPLAVWVEHSRRMPEFSHHIFICGNTREPDHRRGCCNPDGSDRIRSVFKAELKKRGLIPRVRANSAGCLDQCEHGPTVVIYPQAIWYGGVRVEDVARIVEETIIGGRVLADLVIAPSCLNNRACPHVLARASAPSRQP